MPEMADAVVSENVLQVSMRYAGGVGRSQLVRERRIAIVGAMCDVVTRDIEVLVEDGLDQTAL
jgi:hypothetical protein